jgi:hypothetical protein
MQILLIARITPTFGIGYFKFYNNYKIINVKKPITWSKPAEIRNKSYFLVSQRLNAEDLSYAYLVGLIEGDG